MTQIPYLNKKNPELYNAVIETPRHSRNKYDFDPESGFFFLKKTLPEGMSFPFDFGFIPQTLADDGDPIDILIFMDEPGCIGCYVGVRLIGVIEAEQKGKKNSRIIRNDRLIGIGDCSMQYKAIKHIDELDKEMISQIERFFENYNDMEGRQFKIARLRGPHAAKDLVKEMNKRYKKSKNKKAS